MTIILILALTAIVILFADTFAGGVVMGGLRSEKELDAFLATHIQEYTRLNSLDPSIMMDEYPFRLPYITTHRSFLSRWYIKGIGQVPRWSKWSKMLDDHHQALLALI